ncbi:uncharacterized protein I303_108439 [Kwoniella dejecticola CBS 10117]|uniref:Uncharacterized protein n=1 Tax=Kwoniella dejecticola CBS 10117 TaxID=1296121 RepID=A0A1A5ZXE3_9TREE|nr:uncharacterized protein I303_07236 [Kwoniella dejecticola CBS 10117]OBR82476.1 hypothetical protein I303_07236 [Kwoniella dejecticola CBS 10117]
MIFVLEPQSAGSQLGNPDEAQPNGLYTYTLTEGANVIAPTRVGGMTPPSTITNGLGPGVTVTPSSMFSTDSMKSEMIITRPANPTLPTPADTAASQSTSGSSRNSKVHSADPDSTMNYNHTTLIVIVVLACLSILAVGLWYFRRSRAHKLLSNGMTDLESTFQEKRSSISKAISNNHNRRSWIKLNEEIGNIQEKEREAEEVRESTIPPAVLPIQVPQSHLDGRHVEQHQQHARQVQPLEVYEYNTTAVQQIYPNADTQTSSMRTVAERRNSTINHFPVPPSTIPNVRASPPVLATKRVERDIQTKHQQKQEDIFESPKDQLHVLSPEIGVATTSHLPASSSRSAVAVDGYPTGRLTGSGRDLTRMASQDSDAELEMPKRQSLPYVLPVQEAERTPTFISLNQINQKQNTNNDHHKQSPEYRSPTESMYVIYKDRNTIYQGKQ